MSWQLEIVMQHKGPFIFNMINFIGMPSLFFTINPTFFYHPLLIIIDGQNINLNLFYDKK
jgi:hypothetical protein